MDTGRDTERRRKTALERRKAADRGTDKGMEVVRRSRWPAVEISAARERTASARAQVEEDCWAQARASC